MVALAWSAMPPSSPTARIPTYHPTTKRRRGRLTRRQAAALEAESPFYLTWDGQMPADPLPASVTGTHQVILDIGFGSAEPVVAMASAEPDRIILAVDVHTPGIGDLLAAIASNELGNVFVVEADVREVLARVNRGALAGVRTFYPDPWPKKKHEGRRLVTTDFARLLADRVQVGGWWHLATDWSPYAQHMEDQIMATGTWRGGVMRRPPWRPVTRYERNALAAGRESTDLWFERVSS